MSKAPFMPLWVADFLGDTLDLDATEIGAYMLILMAQWQRGGASLPNDEKKIQRVARCGRNWAKVWASIERYFDEDEDGIFSKRLRFEAQNVAAKREVNAQNGARGGSAKSLKRKDAHVANATNSLQRNSSIPEPEPYKKEKDTDVSLSVSAKPTPANDAAKAVDLFNTAAARCGWSQVQKLTPQRSKQIRARLAECGGIDGWEVALRKAEDSDFLSGRTQRPWTGFGFDWFTKQANFTKLMEGNYDNRYRQNFRASDRREDRPDPAIANIARIVGIGEA